MKVKEWIRVRKQGISFVVAILVAEFWPVLTAERPLTHKEWVSHTFTVLVAAVILATIIEYIIKHFQRKKK